MIIRTFLVSDRSRLRARPLFESRMQNELGFLGVAVAYSDFGLEHVFVEIVHKQIEFSGCVGKLLRTRLRRFRMPV